MEEVSIQDWPGPPLDLNSGNNSWMPAYGYQTPNGLLEKEDFIGNPDAEYFFQNAHANCMYLETIQEETSDDLRSDSDGESRNSPVGWLATDSEDGSVIFTSRIEDLDCDSDRELACPPKRRRQDPNFLQIPDDHQVDDETSLSRSSSLLQFESLEQECRESHSPNSLRTLQFSFDLLDGIEGSRRFSSEDFSPEYDGSVFRSFGSDIDKSKQSESRDSLLYNASLRYSSSDSTDSDTTVENSRSLDNLKTWRSFDNLPLSSHHSSSSPPKKFSSENLSEDSGYGDQLLHNSYSKARSALSSSAGNLENSKVELETSCYNMTDFGRDRGARAKRNSYVGFGAYDCDVFQHFNNNNFGISYQDLTQLQPLTKSPRAPLTDAFLRKKHAQKLLSNHLSYPESAVAINLNIKLDVNNREHAKFSDAPHAASVPDLLHHAASSSAVDVQDSPRTFNGHIFISVPKDLNFIGAFQPDSSSVAEKDWDLADLVFSDPTMATYKREGSYSEAMSNRVDLSDDENSLINRKLPKHPIVDFDKKVLKAISEQSIQSLISSTNSLHKLEQNQHNTSTPVKRHQQTCAVSTPDLNRIEPVRRAKDPYFDDDRRKSTHEIAALKYDTSKIEEERSKNILLDCSNSECEEGLRRKGSIIKSSTSTSGMSDIEEKYQSLKDSVRSFSGSNGSKGVHFSPVVAEVNWRDDVSTSTVTPDRESLYSLNSSSPEPLRRRESPKLVKPRPQYPNSHSRRSVSQPDLSDSESKIHKREFIDSLNNLRRYESGGGSMSMSKSQPDVSKFKRRGSQLVKKDKDGCTVKAYVDLDGVQYKHTHLDITNLSQTSLNDQHHAKYAGVVQHQSAGVAAPKNSFTSKFPLSQPLMPTATRTIANNDTEENKVASAAAKQSTGAAAKQSSNVMATTGGSSAIADSSGTTTTKRKTKSGLGGFLQRLASFRLGAKKDQKDKVKRKQAQNGTGATAALPQRNSATGPQQQKPSYIYIPLKGPPSGTATENNNVHKADATESHPVVSKPPLPKQPPPRVVHASVKKAAQAPQPATSDERRRRRTIDSGSGHGVATLPRGIGDGSMDGPPMGLIETDLDTEVTVITNGANAKARSLLDLGVAEPRLQVPQNPDGSQNGAGRPHKSMEFLLDKQNLKVVEPPENELQKTERVMSEHELRVQRSLQKLTVPDWYKNSQIPGQGFLLKKNHQARESTRWTGTTGSKTTSLSSLGTQSPLILSPTPTSQPFVRWSTSKLNSTASSPCQSTRSSFNQGRQQPNGSISPSSARSSFSYRQPYLGWRSQERLSRPRTPAERLASTLLRQPQENPEIQTSIKEVTSAIVHYVSGLKPAEDQEQNSRSSSVSPRGSQKLCWLESSFVGTKPLDSPETPVTCSDSPVPPSQSLRLELQQNHSSNNDLATLSANDTRVRPSPSSTTLEDVLDSLLGLPPSGRAASPCLQETVSASTSPQRRASDDAEIDGGAAYRRRSEGSEPAATLDPSLPTGGAALLRCRYSRCNKTALPSSREARSFKNCHNCSYTYCSRACRRSHWERHRKTCLFSRMGTLCRQVIQAVRDQKDTLRELSKVARRGYISHGLGAVKCFYPNPEAAEKFLADGLQSLGELTFVRWQDLLPTEMGPMLYKELVEMCQNYNAETKFVLYISLCVISETPASGAVKWERQLVSRCAKLRLSKDLNFVGPELSAREIEPPETLILTCPPIRLPTPETSMRARLIAFNNLQAQLRERGVSLKRQYPEIYKLIDEYCEDLSIKPMMAQTIYPRNATTHKSFMCVIMLESDLETLKQVEKAGVKVRTVDCLLSCETTTNM